MNKYVAAHKQLCVDSLNHSRERDPLKREKIFENMKRLAGILYFVRIQIDKYPMDYILNRKNMLEQDISMFRMTKSQIPQSVTDALELCNGCIALQKSMAIH